MQLASSDAASVAMTGRTHADETLARDESVHLKLGEELPRAPLTIILAIRSLPVERQDSGLDWDGSGTDFHPRLRRQQLKCEELALRRRAALPAMANRKERGDGLAKDDKTDGDKIGQ